MQEQDTNSPLNTATGSQMTRIDYTDATEESETWAAEQRGEWTEARAKAWVAAHDDSDELDDDELEAAFRAIFDRDPDDEDREQGLWSLLNA